MSNYPERPMHKGSPKSTHKASKKSRSWLQAPGVAGVKPKIEEHKLAFSVAGHSNPDLQRFLGTYRHNRIPVGTRSKPGPRPFNV